MINKKIEELIIEYLDRPEVFQNNEFILTPYSWGGKGADAKYELTLPKSYKRISSDKEESFTRGKGYFYLKINSNPDIYKYISQEIGGAIVFDGKGRWSGNARDFGKIEFNKAYTDVVIGNESCFAMASKDIEILLKKYFPKLEYKIIDCIIIITNNE